MKKIFSILSVVAMFAMLTSCCCNKQKECEKCEKTPVALQLYSVRGDMAQDFYGTLKAVKEMGYDGVEFAGLYNNEPAQIKAWCEELGLNPISAHVPLAEMLADIDKVIADYKAIGCEYIVVPYVTAERHPDGEKWAQTIEEIKAIGQKAKDAGLVLLYHNHDFEFKLTPDGKIGLDALYEAVPAELLQTELDLCWVKYAGQCPVEYVKKYANRAPVVHFKDYFAAGEQTEDPYALIGLNEGEKKESKAFEFRPLGCGVQDVEALLAAAKEAGSKWIVVEQDSPSLDKSPMECVKMSIDYLKSLCCKKECCDKNCENKCDKAECKGDCKKECDKTECKGDCKNDCDKTECKGDCKKDCDKTECKGDCKKECDKTECKGDCKKECK